VGLLELKMLQVAVLFDGHGARTFAAPICHSRSALFIADAKFRLPSF
jgi:hypothetical protein